MPVSVLVRKTEPRPCPPCGNYEAVFQALGLIGSDGSGTTTMIDVIHGIV